MSIKKGIVYVFIANVINLIISLFTGFVLPKILSIETYSSIKLFQLYVTYIGILHLGFADGMYLRIGGKKLENLNKEEVQQEFRTFKIFQLLVTILAIIISIILKNEMLLFCSIVILPINVGNYIRQVYQAIGLFKKYSNFTNINTLLIFLINIILLFIVKTDNPQTYIICYIIAYMMYWIIIERETAKIFGKPKVKADKKFLFEDIKNGFLLMIGNFCNVIFTGIDRIFVQNFLGSIKFAFYSFAVSIENLMNVFITPISTVMYNYLCNNKSKEQVINLKNMILLFASAVVITIFPAKFIVEIWLQKYLDSIDVLFLLFAAQCITILVRCVHVNLYKAEKKQNRYFIIMMIVVVLSIALNILLFALVGTMEAIALATLITSIVWFIIGEIDFKEYRMKVKNYLYIFFSVSIFLICGQIENTILACIIYMVTIFIFMNILMKNAVKNVLIEVKNFIDAWKRKKHIGGER